MVSYSPTPGAELAPMGNGVLSNRAGCPCHAGLYFEAYSYDPGDLGAEHQLRGVGADFWAARRPVAQHEEHVCAYGGRAGGGDGGQQLRPARQLPLPLARPDRDRRRRR